MASYAELTAAEKYGGREANHVSLAMCLVQMFEKAINVQFQDYHDRLQSAPMQNFFFTGRTESQNNLFVEDLRLADFWQKSTERKKKDLVEPMGTLIKDLIKDYNS